MKLSVVSVTIPQPFQPFQSTEKAPDRVGTCGDGKVQAQYGEECDDGNQIVTDACLSESCAFQTKAKIHIWHKVRLL